MTPPTYSPELGTKFKMQSASGRWLSWQVRSEPIMSALWHWFVWCEPVGEWRRDGSLRVLTKMGLVPIDIDMIPQ